jgi:hypothetical protein
MLFKDDHQYIDFGYVMTLFFLAYSIVMTFPIWFVNLGIIIKEISLEFFQLLTKTVNGQLAPYSLGKADVDIAFYDIFWFLNPFTWIDIFWTAIFGYPVEDYWEENPKDEKRYYKNW